MERSAARSEITMDRELSPAEIDQLRAADGLAPVPGGAEDEVGAARAVGARLREALAGHPRAADAVMRSIALIEDTRGAVDVADAVMASIAVREDTRGPVDVADAVMADIGGRVVRLGRAGGMPAWAALGVPVVVLAAAAALLIGLLPSVLGTGGPQKLTASVAAPTFVLAALNRVEVEDLSAAADATVQVVQFEEEGVTFILVEDAE
jgi:hypothetical protein